MLCYVSYILIRFYVSVNNKQRMESGRQQVTNLPVKIVLINTA